MQERKGERTRREVLADFKASCPRPIMADVRRWQREHPDHADAILHSAAMAGQRLLAEMQGGEAPLEPRDAALASRLVEGHMASRRREAQGAPLAELLARAGCSLERLEADVDIRPGVLGAVLAEGLARPVPRRLAWEVGRRLDVGIELAAASLATVPRAAVWRHAGSRSAAPRRLRTFVEAIASTDMSDERKAFWLGGV